MKAFLKKLAASFLRCIKKLFAEYSASHLLARFLTQSGHFSKEKKQVKQAAFLPTKDLKLSVFRIDGLSQTKTLGLADQYDVTTDRKLYGFARISSETVYSNKLSIDFDNRPERHANIIGWPTEKDAQKLLAIELANSAELVLNTVQ